MAWHGVAWRGVVWCVVLWRGVAWHDVVWHIAVWFGVALRSSRLPSEGCCFLIAEKGEVVLYISSVRRGVCTAAEDREA